jgi:TonB family protein
MKIILTSLLLFTFFAAHAQTDSTRTSTTDSAFYFKPEIQAEFPGGIAGWYRYLQINLRYPDKAISKNIQGTVVTRFMVDSLGLVHDVQVISGPEELRKECIRILEKDIYWSPAVHNGKKVNSWKTQSIGFKLEAR